MRDLLPWRKQKRSDLVSMNFCPEKGVGVIGEEKATRVSLPLTSPQSVWLPLVKSERQGRPRVATRSLRA